MQKQYFNRYLSSLKILKTLIANGSAVVLNFFITLLIIPFVTKSLGTEAYGFVSLANNFVSYITILTIALNSYSVRYISLYYHKAEYDNTLTFYSTIVIANAALSAIIVILGAVFAFFIEQFLTIPNELLCEIKILFFLTFINFAIQTFENSFSVFAYIHDRVDLIGISKFFAYIIEIFAFVFLFKKASPRVWYVSVAHIFYSAIILVANLLIANMYSKEIHVSYKHFSFKAAYELIINGIWNSANSLGNILNTGLDLLITNRMLTSLTMGELAIAKTIGSIIPMIYQLISQAFQPSLLKKYAANDKIHLLHDLKKSMKISGFCIGTFFCIFVSLGDTFFRLWLIGQNNQSIYRLTILTLTGYLMEGVVGPIYYIYTLCVKNKIPCLVTIIGGFFNVVSMTILLQSTSLGAYAVCGTTAIIMTFINLVTNPLYMTHCLNIKWSTFYPIIIRYILFVVITSYFLRKMTDYFYIGSWSKLIFWAVIQVIISFAIYTLIMHERIRKNYL